MTDTVRPVVPGPRRLRRLLRGVASAMAGAGAGLLNAVAALRGHEARSDVAHGPLPSQRFDARHLHRRGTAVPFRSYEHVDHALLVGAPSWPLTAFAPVLDDCVAFMRALAPAASPTPAPAAAR